MILGLTGATGFLGSHVRRVAAAAGHEIIAFSRSAAASIPGARDVRAWPGTDRPNISGCDAVIHLAGESVMGLWTRRKRAAILDSRVDGTRRLVSALVADASRPRILVCASGIGFYGDCGETWIDESSPSGGGFLASVTRAWEAEAAAARPAGLRVVSARIGLVLGPEGGAWPMLRRIFGIGLGGRLGSGSQWMSWIHVEDAARLLVHAAESGALSGPVNVVSPEPVTNLEFTRTVGAILRRPTLAPVPAWAMRLVLRDQASMFLDSQRVRPAAALQSGFVFTHPRLEDALRALVRA